MKPKRAWVILPSKLLLILVFITSLLPFKQAFNLDVKQARLHRNAPNSGFGYSIAFYHYGNEDLLLVGAPFARTNQRDVQRGGQVFKCDVNQNRCAEVIFDRQGNERRLNGSRSLPIEEKSYQMFGATVVTTKAGGTALACAPHYKYFFAKFEVVEPVGTCFYAEDNFNKITEFAPCRQEPARHGHHRFGYGMCGFSGAIPDEGNSRLYIAAPGLWYWQGGVFSQNIHNVTGDRPHSPEGPAYMDNFQIGYSTAAGDFTGDGIDDIVVGAPRANGLIGQVVIYDDKIQHIINLTDPEGQRGQYFGASIAVTDLNKDGLDDLIIGSPFYTDYTTVLDVKTQEHKPQYDIGKIYVYIQSGARSFKAPIQIKGQNQWSRFGYSIAAAGDLNGDGYNDFVVGAPYDGEDRLGAVYVFHGTAEGVREKYTQRIYARDVSSDLRSFGFSLAGGRDIDRNDYPDVAVGAMESSKVAILRTKPVIQVSGFVKTTRKTINLDEKICVTEFGRMPCEKLRFCLKYNGKVLPQHNNIDLKVRIQLDAENGATPRAFFSRKDLDKKKGVIVDRSAVSREQPDIIEQHITLSKGREQCETFDVYVPDTIRDKISPILISVNYTYQERRPHGDGLEPAIDTTLPQSFVTELVIEKDCGDDNICVPDLKINAQATKEKFTIGTGDKTLTVNVTVRNQGEDSYLTQYRIEIPPGFEYGGVENYDSKHKVTCSPVEEGGKKKGDEPYEFLCEIGNPLPANERADFGVKLTGSDVDASKEFVEVKMAVNSTNPEEAGTTRDNDIVLKVPVEVKAQLDLIGQSKPDHVDYSTRNRTEGEHATFDFEVGPVVSHLFEVINRGPSIIKRSTLDIYWPSFADGKPLLYLIDMPFISNPTKARCVVKQAHNVNSAGLAISNEHVKALSSGIETEEAETSVSGGGQRKPNSDDDFEDDRQPYEAEDEPEFLRRKKRIAAKAQKHRRQLPESVRKKLREQKAEMREAIRLAKEAGGSIEYRGSLNRAELNCNSLNCTHISCDIDELQPEEYVLVEIVSRLWLNTLIDMDFGESDDISSLAFAQITSLPFAPKYIPPPKVLAVSTSVNPIDPEQTTSVPWWLYLLAILIALLILASIVYCCYKCGFFKRNRPQYTRAQFNKGGGVTEYDY